MEGMLLAENSGWLVAGSLLARKRTGYWCCWYCYWSLRINYWLDPQNKLMLGLALDNPYLDHVHHHHNHKAAALDLLHKHQGLPIAALYIVALPLLQTCKGWIRLRIVGFSQHGCIIVIFGLVHVLFSTYQLNVYVERCSLFRSDYNNLTALTRSFQSICRNSCCFLMRNHFSGNRNNKDLYSLEN